MAQGPVSRGTDEPRSGVFEREQKPRHRQRDRQSAVLLVAMSAGDVRSDACDIVCAVIVDSASDVKATAVAA
jgi:hypothetical protein